MAGVSVAECIAPPLSPFDCHDGREPGGEVRPRVRAQEEEPQAEEEMPEAKHPVVLKGPADPTTEEILAHNVTHLPYRSWCPHCVRGRGKSAAHARRDKEKETSMPTIAVDYHFLGEKEGDEKCLPCLAVRDLKSRVTGDSVVISKGTNKYSLEFLTKFVDGLGYKEIILKSDQEPAIRDLCENFKATWHGNVVPEMSPVEDSESNGGIERAIQSISAQVRVMKDALEAHIGEKVEPNAPILAWLVSHAATLLTLYEQSADGKTAYERLKGKTWDRPMIEFAEKVHYRKLVKKGRQGKLSIAWGQGLFLGIIMGSTEKIIGTPEGVVKCRTVLRMPLAERWSKVDVKAMKGLPWKPHHEDDDAAIAPEIITMGPISDAQVPIPQLSDAREVRRSRISRKSLKTYGYTAGCPGCLAARTGGVAVNHSPACRKRIEDIWAKTP